MPGTRKPHLLAGSACLLLGSILFVVGINWDLQDSGETLISPGLAMAMAGAVGLGLGVSFVFFYVATRQYRGQHARGVSAVPEPAAPARRAAQDNQSSPTQAMRPGPGHPGRVQRPSPPRPRGY